MNEVEFYVTINISNLNEEAMSYDIGIDTNIPDLETIRKVLEDTLNALDS